MSLRHKTTAVSATTVAVLILLTAGCSGSTDTTDKVTSSKSSAGSTGSGQAAGQMDEVASGAAGANIDPMNLPKPVVSLTTPRPTSSDPDATARIDIYSIKRQGRLAILTLSITPKTNSTDSVAQFTFMGNHFFSPSLVDPVNLREYEVVSSSKGSLSTGNTSARSYSGQPMFVWAVFAAPPPNVQKVNLNLYSFLPTFMDVPVQ
jgi:hypothetical protein